MKAERVSVWQEKTKRFDLGNMNEVTEETAIEFSNQEPIFLLLLPPLNQCGRGGVGDSRGQSYAGVVLVSRQLFAAVVKVTPRGGFE